MHDSTRNHKLLAGLRIGWDDHFRGGFLGKVFEAGVHEKDLHQDSVRTEVDDRDATDEKVFLIRETQYRTPVDMAVCPGGLPVVILRSRTVNEVKVLKC